jgi:hypothetical protein
VLSVNAVEVTSKQAYADVSGRVRATVGTSDSRATCMAEVYSLVSVEATPLGRQES